MGVSVSQIISLLVHQSTTFMCALYLLLPTLDSGLTLLLCHHPDNINRNRHSAQIVPFFSAARYTISPLLTPLRQAKSDSANMHNMWSESYSANVDT